MTRTDYLTSLRTRLREIAQERKGLDAEERDINSILARHQADMDAAPPKRRAKRRARNGEGNTSQLVMEWVRQHQGMQPRDIAMELEEKISTTSDEPRKLIRATISTLVKRKKLRATPNGAIFPLTEEAT